MKGTHLFVKSLQKARVVTAFDIWHNLDINNVVHCIVFLYSEPKRDSHRPSFDMKTVMFKMGLLTMIMI